MSMADERIDRDTDGGIGSPAEESGKGSRKRGGRAKAERSSKQKKRPKWAKVLLWILRRSIVPLIMMIMLIIGLYAGYVVLGNGPKADVFNWSTWRHLYDLIFAES